MACHLMEKEQFESAKELSFEVIERYVESSHFDLWLCKCTQCGQLYIGCYVEVVRYMVGEDDDNWDFWVPVDAEDVKAVRADHRRAMLLFGERRHITLPPTGGPRWRTGPEIAFAMIG